MDLIQSIIFALLINLFISIEFSQSENDFEAIDSNNNELSKRSKSSFGSNIELNQDQKESSNIKSSRFNIDENAHVNNEKFKKQLGNYLNYKMQTEDQNIDKKTSTIKYTSSTKKSVSASQSMTGSTRISSPRSIDKIHHYNKSAAIEKNDTVNDKASNKTKSNAITSTKTLESSQFNGSKTVKNITTTGVKTFQGTTKSEVVPGGLIKNETKSINTSKKSDKDLRKGHKISQKDKKVSEKGKKKPEISDPDIENPERRIKDNEKLKKLVKELRNGEQDLKKDDKELGKNEKESKKDDKELENNEKDIKKSGSNSQSNQIKGNNRKIIKNNDNLKKDDKKLGKDEKQLGKNEKYLKKDGKEIGKTDKKLENNENDIKKSDSNSQSNQIKDNWSLDNSKIIKNNDDLRKYDKEFEKIGKESKNVIKELEDNEKEMKRYGSNLQSNQIKDSWSLDNRKIIKNNDNSESYKKKMKNKIRNAKILRETETSAISSSYFFIFGIFVLIFSIILYVIYQSRKKILGYLIEGRRSSSRPRSRGNSGAGFSHETNISYKPLSSEDLEQGQKFKLDGQ